MEKERDRTRKLSRSSRLKKYGLVYEEVIKKLRNKNHSSIKKSEKESLNKSETKQTKTQSKKESILTDYQKFVKKESSKEKYSSMKASERLSAIALAWEYEKKYRRRKEKKK